MTPEDYASALKALLPPGRLWRLDGDSNLSAVFLATGDELVRVEGRGLDLIEEADPRTTSELLPDFERVLGLDAEGTEADRRARVVAVLTSRRRFRPVDFQAFLVDLLGYADPTDVTVIEISRADAVAMNNDTYIYRFYVFRDPTDAGVLGLTATTISFTAPDTMSDSGNGLGIFSPGDKVRVAGSTTKLNDGVYVVDTVAAGQVTFEEQTVTTQAAGPSVTATSYDLDGAQDQVDRMQPAHTDGKVIESTSFTCGDPFSLCGRDLLDPSPTV